MRKDSPTIYHVKDIWKVYSYSLLASNPTWVAYNKNKVENFQLCRKYKEDGKTKVDNILNYLEFKNVIKLYFRKAKEGIITGGVLDLKNRMGKLAARRVERDHSKRVIDHGKTSKQPKMWSEKKQRMVATNIIFFTDDDWCRIGWHKQRSITNEKVYEFVGTRNLRNGEGFNQMLNTELKKNKTLKYKYLYFPLKPKKVDDL